VSRAETTEKAFVALLVVAVSVLILGNLLGQPLLLGFVETDSMSPTLESGDMFFALPTFVTGSPSKGDVVVYEAEEIQGGGLTTHRVVGETDGGYITKGDSNPFTDQDGGEPVVTEGKVVADVLQVGGTVVSVPYVGTAVGSVRGSVAWLLSVAGVGTGDDSGVAGFLLFSAGVVLFFLSLFGGKYERKRGRSVSKGYLSEQNAAVLFTVLLLLVVLVPANYAMLSPGGEYELELGELDDEYEATDAESEVTVSNDGFVAMVVVLDSAGGNLQVRDGVLEVPGGEEVKTSVSPKRVSEKYVLTEHRYFMLLPPSLLTLLHSTSPFLALLAVNAVLGVGVVGLSLGLVSTKRGRRRGRSLPPSERVRRELRRFL